MANVLVSGVSLGRTTGLWRPIRMKVVIQCAATKQPTAGGMRTADGRPVYFVAHPDLAPADQSRLFACPDDPVDTATPDGPTWRDRLIAYNHEPEGNPLGLLPAIDLYRDRAYRALAERVPPEDLYVLSAGWGLLRADFLTPTYDITFSPQADAWKQRRRKERYADFRLPSPGKAPAPLDATSPTNASHAAEGIVFFGGQDYLPLFTSLTDGHPGERIAIHGSAEPPSIPGIRAIAFQTRRRTNWHYDAVHSFLAGLLRVDAD